MRMSGNNRKCNNLKMPENRTKELENMGLWDMSIDEFDSIDDSHEFSERYKRKKRRLLSGLKDIEALKNKADAEEDFIVVRKSGFRTAAVVAAAVLLIPTTVFAAARLYEIRVTQKQHEAQVDIELQNDSAKPLTAGETYIKRGDGISVIAARSPIKVTLSYVPEECVYYDDYKYEGADFNGTYGISMMMLVGDSAFRCEDKVKYSIASEKREVNGTEYAVVTKDETFVYNKEVFMPLESWNGILLMYVGKGISIDEMDKIIAGVQVEETTDMAEAIPSENIEDSLWLLGEDEAGLWTGETVVQDTELHHIGDTMKQGNFSITVDKIETFHSIKDFSRENFYTDVMPGFVGEDGTLGEYNRAEIIPGDGVTSVNRFADKKKMRQRFVYITLTLKTGKQAVSQYYINNMQSRFLKVDAQGTYSVDGRTLYNLDEERNANFWEPIYFDRSAEGNQSKGFFNMGALPANTEITVHVGFLADEDMLDEMYIDISGGYDGIEQAPGYYVKVLE